MQGIPNATSTGYIQPMGTPMFSPHSSMINASNNAGEVAFQPFGAPNAFPMAGQPVPPFNGSMTYPPMMPPLQGNFAPNAFLQPPLLAQNFNNAIDSARKSLLSASTANFFPQAAVNTSVIQPQTDFQITETVVSAPRRSVTRIFRPSASYYTTETAFGPAVSTVETILPQIRRSVSHITTAPLVAPTITTERVIRRSVSSYRTSPTRVSVSRQVFPVTETVIEPIVSNVYVPATTTTVTYPARTSVVSTSYVESGSYM